MIEIIGMAVTVIAVAGVVFNNRHRRICFILWMISNFLSACVHVHAGLWTLCLRDTIFFGLCIEGWYRWGRKTG